MNSFRFICAINQPGLIAIITDWASNGSLKGVKHTQHFKNKSLL